MKSEHVSTECNWRRISVYVDRSPYKRLFSIVRLGKLSGKTVLFAINHTTKAVNTKSWCRSARMGVNNLNSLVKRIAEKVGLDAKNLTNHSGRKRMIQKLNDLGVPPTHIIQGHKNVQSEQLQHTVWTTTKRHFQNSGPLKCQGAARLSSRYFQRLILNASKTLRESKTQQPLTLFQGASIHDWNCYISVNSLNESPILSTISKVQKGTPLFHWIKQWLLKMKLYLIYFSVLHFISMRT